MFCATGVVGSVLALSGAVPVLHSSLICSAARFRGNSCLAAAKFLRQSSPVNHRPFSLLAAMQLSRSGKLDASTRSSSQAASPQRGRCPASISATWRERLRLGWFWSNQLDEMRLEATGYGA